MRELLRPWTYCRFERGTLDQAAKLIREGRQRTGEGAVALSASLKQHGIPVKIEECSLPAGKATHVHRIGHIDAHPF